jgi:hypothetical protein
VRNRRRHQQKAGERTTLKPRGKRAFGPDAAEPIKFAERSFHRGNAKPQA